MPLSKERNRDRMNKQRLVQPEVLDSTPGEMKAVQPGDGVILDEFGDWPKSSFGPYSKEDQVSKSKKQVFKGLKQRFDTRTT